MKVDVGVENVKEVSTALALLEDLPKYLHPQVRDWAAQTTNTFLWGMKNYAPAPAGSTYQRTGELGNSWGIREAGPGQVSFENAAGYAQLVVGDDQAWMHRGRWWMARERIEENLLQLVQILSEALGKWPGR